MVFVDNRRHALLMLSYAGSWDATATATKDDCTKVNKVSNDIELKDSKRERTGDNPAWAVDGFGDVPICRHHGSSVQNRSDRLGGPMKSFVLPVNLDVGENDSGAFWATSTLKDALEVHGKFVPNHALSGRHPSVQWL